MWSVESIWTTKLLAPNEIKSPKYSTGWRTIISISRMKSSMYGNFSLPLAKFIKSSESLSTKGQVKTSAYCPSTISICTFFTKPKTLQIDIVDGQYAEVLTW